MFGISGKSVLKSQGDLPYVYYYEDFASKDLSEIKVGRKGLSLFELYNADIPVPNFFVVSPSVYKNVVYQAFEDKLADLLEKKNFPKPEDLATVIAKSKLDPAILEALLKAYSRLSGFTDAWVSVRSSVVFPSRPNISFSGLFATELNVRGFDELVEAIISIYCSVFNDKVAQYAKNLNIDLSELKMAVVVQKMVQAEVSGIILSVDPATGDKNLLRMEAVYGLGDVIANGEITPDSYLLRKKDLVITEKKIAPQEWMRVRKIASNRESKHTGMYEQIQISQNWSHQQKLEDRFIQDIAKIGLIIEDKLNTPQDIEWVWESGNIWILQNKPIKNEVEVKPLENILEQKSLVDLAAGIVKTTKMEEKTLEEAVKLVQKESIIEKEKTQKNEEQQNTLVNMDLKKEISDESTQKIDSEMERLYKLIEQAKENERKTQITVSTINREVEVKQADSIMKEVAQKGPELIVSGLGVSGGIVRGSVLIIKASAGMVRNITKNTILIIDNYTLDMEPYIFSAGGVILEEAGLSSDISILCREMKIPAIVNVVGCSKLFKNGDVVELNGDLGGVYKFSEVEQTNIEPIAKPVTPIDTIVQGTQQSILNIVRHEKIPTATKVLLTHDVSATNLGDFILASDGIVNVDLDKLIVAHGIHPQSREEGKSFAEIQEKILNRIDEIADIISPLEIIVSIGSATEGEFRALTGCPDQTGSQLGNDAIGAIRYLSNPSLLKKVLLIVKKLRNTFRDRNVSLAIHSPLNGNYMSEIKKEISANGLRRGSTFNLYAVLESSSEILLLEDIYNAEIDGVVVNTSVIAREVQGLARFDMAAKYDISAVPDVRQVGSVLSIVEQCIKIGSKKRKRSIVLCEKDEKLIKECVKYGVYGVAVDMDFIVDAKLLVQREETALIKSR